MKTEENIDTDTLPSLGEKPVHLVCCRSDFLAICGNSVVGKPYLPKSTPLTCADCIELDFQSPYRCPPKQCLADKQK